MLIGLDPALSPDLLRVLRAMGHGDVIAIVDANFPAEACAQRLVRADGLSATRMLQAVLSVMPLDHMSAPAAFSMEVVGDPEAIPDAVADFQSVIDTSADTPSHIGPIERFAFYEKARDAFAILQTGEGRLYGNIMLIKGVVQP
ncbi:RbsD/FucU domain-containing protein [Tropicimonas sp. TH_r6]|uniref:RbsD/FucU family protein n=1 Tax=Tropicimonas sp. TH_r6 TaxID=3082085 RepID=UPI002954FD9E|nr:RbsD/FucU domain-containing protein [Tropicimonas sp. TH_r6]MDV7145568.1 RbsD/FucU domain-containing protein [Tropicimonas sp. TH_r6]